MTSADLLALAERVEAASGPSSELNLAIFRALNPKYAGDEWWPYGGGLRHVNDSSDARCLPPPEATPARYTASLDAAMTLLPGTDWEWSLEACEGSLLHSALDRQMVYTAKVGDPMRRWECEAATPALALTAASLRARAAQEPGR